MANGRAFIIGSVFSVLGTALLLYMMHDTSWMVRDSPESSVTERVEFGLYASTLQYSEDNHTVMAYGDDDEWATKTCEASSNSPSTEDDKMCEVISAGETGHWFMISGISLVVIALVLAGIGMSGNIPGRIPLYLNIIATLVIIVGSVIWLVQFPDLNVNTDSDEPRLSPSYGFYISLASTALISLGGLAWGGVEAFNIETDDDMNEEDEWHDAMATADPSSANWRDQNVPTSVQGTEAPHQYQQDQMMQQYEFQDQGYHHQQSYAEPRQDWQRSAPRSGPSGPSAAPSSGPPGPSATPASGPPGSTATPTSGPPGPSAAPASGPPGSTATPTSGPPGPSAAPASGPPGSTATPTSGPPGPQSAQRQGPPGSTYGLPQQPKVRKATQPVQQPVPAAPVQQPAPTGPPAQQPAPTGPPAQQPVPPAAPVQQSVPAAAPVQQIPSTQQLQQYIAPHQMPTTAQSTPPPEVKGQVRPDGWEIIEWPQGSSRWFWKNQNTGQWSRWT